MTPLTDSETHISPAPDCGNRYDGDLVPGQPQPAVNDRACVAGHPPSSHRDPGSSEREGTPQRSWSSWSQLCKSFDPSVDGLVSTTECGRDVTLEHVHVAGRPPLGVVHSLPPWTRALPFCDSARLSEASVHPCRMGCSRAGFRAGMVSRWRRGREELARRSGNDRLCCSRSRGSAPGTDEGVRLVGGRRGSLSPQSSGVLPCVLRARLRRVRRLVDSREAWEGRIIDRGVSRLALAWRHSCHGEGRAVALVSFCARVTRVVAEVHRVEIGLERRSRCGYRHCAWIGQSSSLASSQSRVLLGWLP